MPTFPLPHEEMKEADKEEEGVKQEILWEAEWSDSDDDEAHDFRPPRQPQQQTRPAPRHVPEGGMCLMGQYLLGVLFAGLCGFFTKRVLFREAAGGGAVPYSFLLLVLDGLMVRVV